MQDTQTLHVQFEAQRPFLWGKGLGFLLSAGLYAALTLIFCDLCNAPFSVFALLFGTALLIVFAILPRRWMQLLLAAVILLAAAALILLWEDMLTGIFVLCNRLFEASEAVNDYQYQYFIVNAANPDACVSMALLPLSALCAAICGCASAGKRPIWAVILFLLVSGIEIYLGITPALWCNLFLFAVLGLMSVSNGGHTHRALILCTMAVLSVLVIVIAPRPNARIEQYSEHLRDQFDLLISPTEQEQEQPEPDLNETHQEDRFHEDNLTPPDRTPEYDKETHNQQQISLPNPVNYGKILIVSLCILALLLLPFLPFVLLDRRRRKAEKLREEFDSPDCAAAIRAMFRHIMRYLQVCGLPAGNRPYSACVSDVAALAGDHYAADYALALPLWQEAMYSDHSMSVAQRDQIAQLLSDTETNLYHAANRRTRFRLNFIECLHQGGNQL